MRELTLMRILVNFSSISDLSLASEASFRCTRMLAEDLSAGLKHIDSPWLQLRLIYPPLQGAGLSTCSHCRMLDP